MEFSTKVAAADAVKADCVAVGIYADGSLTAAARRIDAASNGAVSAAVKSGDATGKRGNVVPLRDLSGIASPRVLLVGLGKREEFNDKAFADAVRAAVRSAGAGVKDLALAVADWKLKGRDHAWQSRTLALAARETVFRTDELKSKKEDNGPRVTQMQLLLDARDAHAEQGLKEGVAIANGTALAKRLGNLPANVKAVNTITVKGSGTATDPWGPA